MTRRPCGFGLTDSCRGGEKVAGTNGTAGCDERSSVHATDSSSALASWRGLVSSCRISGRALILAWFGATRTMPHCDRDLVLEEQLAHPDVDPTDRVG